MRSPELLPRGHRVGNWIVEEPLGAGGWATVYGGRRAGPGGPEHVALKVMPTAGLAPRQARHVATAARREVELARKAPHPRLVRLFDDLVLDAPDHPDLDGARVLVMERARCTLRELLGTGVDQERGARIVAGICEGLAHLHASGWIHGDLKPENVLIGEDGEIRLSDFGLAIELTGTHGYTAPVGTPDYLPPERWKEPLGVDGVRVRPTSDVWALGILIHEVFAGGVSPFPGATATARSAAVQAYAEGRTPLRMDHTVPEFWRAVAADCLAPTHTARAPHTAAALLARVRAHRTGPRPRRSRTALLTLAACAMTVCAALPLLPDTDGGTEPVRIRVYNAEHACQNRTDRARECSLGLAVDPLLPYTAENVVGTRVWHHDVLEAECRLLHGQTIIDEQGTNSPAWYRVRLPHPTPHATTAWLPAVRAETHPPLPNCAEPARESRRHHTHRHGSPGPSGVSRSTIPAMAPASPAGAGAWAAVGEGPRAAVR
ncbi:serine/threonine-protein kinase [Streptomyces sp. NPDC005012]|uniref:serine/threonine-protein kinase n=1 Tax=Streptomyces sp. NPDC005012 TaxID=3154558 RepID=UPI0033AB2C72